MNKLVASGLLLCSLGCGASSAAEPSEPAHESPEPPPVIEPTVEPTVDPTPPDTDPRQACTAASDCVLVEAACGGSIGVNAAHAAVFAEEQINMRPLISCLAGPPVPPPVHAECVNAVCTAVLDELPGAES